MRVPVALLPAALPLLLAASPALVVRSEPSPSAAATVESGETTIRFREELRLSAEDRAVLAAFIGHALDFAGKQTADGVKAKCLKSPEMFAWVDFRYLDCLNTAYELTGDTAYLDRFRDTFRLYRDIMTEEHDSYLGWYGSPIPPRVPKDRPDIRIDEIQMNFRAIGMLSRWVELARSDAAYARANAAVIADHLALMENHLFPKWDARDFYEKLDRAGVYRGLDYPLRDGVGTLSHEKFSIIVDGLLGLHRATGNPAPLRRALEVGAWFKQCLSLKDDRYAWMSWSPAGPWDVSPTKPDAWNTGWIAPDPNGEWYVAALSIALNLYRHGLLFTDEDLARFVRTQKEACWNGSLETPEYRTVEGVSGADNKHVKGRFLSYQIAHYDPVLVTLAFDGPHEAEIRKNASSSWQGGANAQSYIREKYILGPVIQKQPRPYLGFGERFLASPENRAFHDHLFFEVVPPGAITPRKPSEAGFLKSADN